MVKISLKEFSCTVARHASCLANIEPAILQKRYEIAQEGLWKQTCENKLYPLIEHRFIPECDINVKTLSVEARAGPRAVN